MSVVSWPEDGYRLFEIASRAGACVDGLFRPMGESNFLAMRRDTFEALGRYDERFDLPGGGLANLDLYRRACERPGAELFLLAGEGTFHQTHGGAATTAAAHASYVARATRQYGAIRGRAYERPAARLRPVGPIHSAAWPFVLWSARAAA